VRKAALLAVNVIVSLGLVELGLRILRPAPLFERIVVEDNFPTESPERLQYTLSPNRKLIYVPKSGSGEYNRDGYRGPIFPLERPRGLFRIVVIGDSVVEGLGVEVEQRFTSVLAERLGPRYEIINLGVRGYGLVQEVEYLKQKGLAYAPDHVMVGITHNDLRVDSAEWNSLARKFEAMEESAFYRAYYEVRDGVWARLLDLHLVRHLLFLRLQAEQGEGPFALEQAKEDHTLAPEEAVALVAELAALAGEHGFGLSFLLLPVNASRRALELVAEAALEHDLPVLDLDAMATDAFPAAEKPDLFLFRDPCHLTPEASIWTAERILENLDALLRGSSAPARGPHGVPAEAFTTRIPFPREYPEGVHGRAGGSSVPER
jgi:hypothetical protein